MPDKGGDEEPLVLPEDKGSGSGLDPAGPFLGLKIVVERISSGAADRFLPPVLADGFEGERFPNGVLRNRIVIVVSPVSKCYII